MATPTDSNGNSFSPEQIQALLSSLGPLLGGGGGAAAGAAGAGALGAAAGGAALLNPVTAGLAAIPAIYQWITGLTQTAKAKAIERANTRTVYRTPEQIREATGLGRTAYNDPSLAGSANVLNQLRGNVANTAYAAKDIGGGTAAQLAALQGAENAAMQGTINLGLAGAQQQEMQRRELEGLLSQEAGFADKEFQYNRVDPYEKAAEAASALRESGQRNTFAGLSNALSAGMVTQFGQGGGAKKQGGGATGGMPSTGLETMQGMTPPSIVGEPSESSMRTGMPTVPAGNQFLPTAPFAPNVTQNVNAGTVPLPDKLWFNTPDQRPAGYDLQNVSPMATPPIKMPEIPQREMIKFQENLIDPEEYKGLEALMNYPSRMQYR